MKTYIITTWNARCGIATYSAYLADALIVHPNMAVKILAEKREVLPTGFDADFPYKDISYLECWSRNEPFDTLLKVVEEEKPDVVHIQHQFGLFPDLKNMQGLYKGLKGKTKVVTTLHDVIPYNPGYEEYFRTLIEGSDKIVVHNEICYRLMESQWKGSWNKLKLIYHGTKIVEVPDKNKTRAEMNIPLEHKVILSWGFIWESKGISDIVEILAELKKTYPNIKFIHAGGLHPVFNNPEYLKKILKEAFRLGIKPDELLITGFVKEDDLPKYFAVADLIILNYMRGSASASGAAHRALSSHRPIIGTDDPCIQEIPKQEVTRFDKQALYKGIVKVLEDTKLQEELVKKEESFAQETSWQNIAKQHISQVYS